MEEMQRIMEKENKEVQNVLLGGDLGGIKTGAKRKRLRKCDIEKAKGKKFFILRALQVV